jgi:predicted metal-dependent enzyme (double-stranded beta helix superfamily)
MTLLLTAARRFVDELRALYESEPDEARRWTLAEGPFRDLLGDDELAMRAGQWPLSYDRANQRYTNLLFYEDPDHGFVLNGLVKDQTGQTAVHDHGHAWVLYGLLEGSERIVRYERRDDGSVPGRSDLRLAAEIDLHVGEVDLVPPGSPHAERSVSERTVAVIARSAKVGTFRHCRYDPDEGTVVDHPGPPQVAHPLI